MAIAPVAPPPGDQLRGDPDDTLATVVPPGHHRERPGRDGDAAEAGAAEQAEALLPIEYLDAVAVDFHASNLQPSGDGGGEPKVLSGTPRDPVTWSQTSVVRAAITISSVSASRSSRARRAASR